MNQDHETDLKLHISLYVPNRIYNNAVTNLIPLMDYEDITLDRKQKFQPHKQGSTASYRSRDYH